MARRPPNGWPKKCWGPGPYQHAEGCRPGRPKCRWMRQVRAQRRTCYCSAYPFPHRRGSGGCGNPLKAELYYFGADERYREQLLAELARTGEEE